MDLLLILRDALASSVAGSLLTAMDARNEGHGVAVLFTQEALAALVGGSFEWPRELSGQDTRMTLADRGAAMGVPLLGRGQGRQLDVKGLVSEAAKAGVVIYACPVWSSLLDLEDRLPEGVSALDRGALAKLLQDTRRVIGTL
jgi:predicted peroxiredoxin